MSYARFGRDSDVYVFLSTQGHLECCACGINGGGYFKAETTEGMIRHLDAHEDVGDAVPDYTYEGLGQDAERNDRWIAAGDPDLARL